MAAPGPVQAGGNGGGQGNSSDFTFRMLEEPEYSDIVKWTASGDTFVVVESHKFTDEILPKHFKHSNFASFVRQLNKYDFHKVRYGDDAPPTDHGNNAWEFKHELFTQRSKHLLDNIRRKAPAPKKSSQHDNATHAVQQVQILSESVTATNMQMAPMQKCLTELLTRTQMLSDTIAAMQRNQAAMAQANHQLINYLMAQDENRRSNRHAMPSNHAGQSTAFHNNLSTLPDGNDEPSSDLRRARDLVNSVTMQQTNGSANQNIVPTMPMAYESSDSGNGAAPMVFPQANSGVMPPTMMPTNPFTGDPGVYPAGNNIGIDPFHPENLHQLPFSLPEIVPTTARVESKTKEAGEGIWGSRKPTVLLVEDDKTCSRIGSKFLSTVDCIVECAQDGEEASNKVNADPERFDLIFMDIIMPKCDGISATIFIRSVNARVPIIAMTSNIRAEDMETYFHWGMNDILAKPFTKDGMVKILKKYCRHLLKNPEGHTNGLEPNGNNASYPAAPSASPQAFSMPANVATGGNVKFETTPGNSPATSSSWHSPSVMMQPSPNLETTGYMTTGINVSAGGPQMSHMVTTTSGGAMQAPGTMPQSNYAPQLQHPSIPRMHVDISGGGGGAGEGPPDKRQRISYGAPANSGAYRR
ncbi:kinase-regulated stress-responsive transcription factor skn7 [Gnomoniopsis smithogilvyi]|uniref:Transcription factor n=1 Tax=Gnomoniopsis smithogilvyi TaxID=1191159 RepID=A0A9W9CU76_9PEZI|nr:kinase-regulated stress-responsive transcription factor skn7 [Gnomoniopsis smithogilvyi]